MTYEAECQVTGCHEPAVWRFKWLKTNGTELAAGIPICRIHGPKGEKQIMITKNMVVEPWE